jgi:type I restriction enzyme, S subunit
MSFPRYERYKDSGRDWLGTVPAHWHVIPLKYVATLKGRLGWQGLRAEEYTEEGPFLVTSEHFTNEAIDWGRCYHVSQERYELAPEIQLRAHDLLMMKDGAAMGKLAYVESVPGPACLNSHLLLFRPRDGRFANRFLFYLLGGPIFETYMIQERTGTTFFGISQESIGAFSVALPPVDEQRLILAFLAYELGKIDVLIAEQKRLLVLLKEKRQAVISHAVTKGLNPNAPMKNSGIEWLGKVPEHWEIGPLKRAFACVDYGISDSLESSGEIAVLRMGNINGGKVIMDDLKYVDSVAPGLLLEKGDLLFNRTNSLDLIGKVGIFEGGGDMRVSFASYLVRLRTRAGCVSGYFGYLLNTPGVLGEARANAIVAIGQCNLNPTRYGAFTVAMPPENEQREILAFLEEETSKLDTLTKESESAIALLRERRTSLIFAAVTGKIDVRGLIVGVRPEEVAAE